MDSSRFEEIVAAYQPKDFAGALRRPNLAVIAEMKQRTPSMGVLSEDYRPADLAHAYADGGAAAISVLTHMAGFGGRPEHIRMVRAATQLPILRKDFVTDPYEIAEARACGADAVLLIVAAVEGTQLREVEIQADSHLQSRRTELAQHERDFDPLEFDRYTRLQELTRMMAESRGITALVEVHDEAQAAAALEAGAQVIGVNHRDLRTFAVDLGLTERLRKLIPKNVLVVAESGVRTAADARRMREAGADAVLVGEALMRSADPARQIKELSV